jgi:hypothetical protein
MPAGESVQSSWHFRQATALLLGATARLAERPQAAGDGSTPIVAAGENSDATGIRDAV